MIFTASASLPSLRVTLGAAPPVPMRTKCPDVSPPLNISVMRFSVLPLPKILLTLVSGVKSTTVLSGPQFARIRPRPTPLRAPAMGPVPVLYRR